MPHIISDLTGHKLGETVRSLADTYANKEQILLAISIDDICHQDETTTGRKVIIYFYRAGGALRVALSASRVIEGDLEPHELYWFSVLYADIVKKTRSGADFMVRARNLYGIKSDRLTECILQFASENNLY